jgi:hypothetical protein
VSSSSPNSDVRYLLFHRNSELWYYSNTYFFFTIHNRAVRWLPGDFCQLPLICDPGGLLYGSKPLQVGPDMVALYGRAAYAALQGHCYELTEPVRQQRGSVVKKK